MKIRSASRKIALKPKPAPSANVFNPFGLMPRFH
jgi:hypothetical protein